MLTDEHQVDPVGISGENSEQVSHNALVVFRLDWFATCGKYGYCPLMMGGKI